MNHLASGGHLHNSCKCIFKSTPVNVGIKFVVRAYPKADRKVYMPPPVRVLHDMFNRLPTGNVRVEAGLMRIANIVNSASF